MRKTTELKRIIEELTAKANALQVAENVDEALKVANDLKAAKAEYAMALAAEDAQGVFNKSSTPVMAPVADKAKALRQAWNKRLLGRALSDTDLKVLDEAGTPGQVEVPPEKGGYLVPQEQLDILLTYRRALIALKDICHVINVKKPSGVFPVNGEETGVLTKFDELTEITKSDIDFSQVAWQTGDYGDIIPVSNTLLSDNDFDILGIIGQRFARKAVNTENAALVTLLSGLTAVAGSDYKAITAALNKTLDSAISAAASIITNQDGFDYLDNLEDKNGRPLMSIDLVDATQRRFKGRPVVVVPNNILKTKGTALPYYVGSMLDYAVFFDLMGVEVAVSAEAGFTKNATYIRAIERFDAKVADKAAMAAITITPA